MLRVIVGDAYRPEMRLKPAGQSWTPRKWRWRMKPTEVFDRDR